MIDEKKIEVAAAYYAEVNTISVEDQWGDMIIDTEELSEAYKEGAHWAINEFLKDLWHPDSDKPVMSEHGMILVELNDITAYKYSLWRSTTTYECLCNNKGYIRRWLYVDELFPKEGGEK